MTAFGPDRANKTLMADACLENPRAAGKPESSTPDLPLRRWMSLPLRLYRLYCATLRVQAILPDGAVVHPEQYPCQNTIFAHSERDSLALASVLLFHRRFVLLVALGRDGDWATAALRSLGSTVVRGSVLRGGSRALRRLIQLLLSSSLPAAVAVDGPLGPPGQAKPGIVLCARLTGRPIVPVATAAERRLKFPGTWSGIFLPLPFSRVWIVCGDPLPVSEKADRMAIRTLSQELTERLARARRHAESFASAGRR